jgi:arabinogalactan oligomer/maltooligosaccharide transport system permease protein
MKKSKKILVAIMSAIVWGSGQLLNKQKTKALLFFLAQVALIGTELMTSYWDVYFFGTVPAAWRMKEIYGYFTKGIWGLVTLGEVPGARGGDHSIVLMITGIIALFILMLFLFIYIWNIRDAYLTRKNFESSGKQESSLQYFKKLWENMFEYIVITPSIILILFVSVMPIVFSLLVGFTNYNLSHIPPGKLVDWVGFSNFLDIFRIPIWTSTFIGVFQWTVLWTILSTVTVFFGGLFQAVLINNKRVKLKKFWRSIFILPWAIPQMVSLLVFAQLFNSSMGPINMMLKDWGLINENIPWLIDPTLAKVTMLAVNLWLGAPYFMMLMSGVMTNLDKSIYEAAEIDGANERQQFWKITLPLVLYATAPLLIMTFAFNFNNFGAVFFLTGGGPPNPAYQYAGHTDLLISWIYKLTISFRMYNMATVVSFAIFIIIGSVSAWNFSRTKAFKEEDMM